MIGRGRVGSAVAARLAERGVDAARTTPSSSSSACPTGAIAEVAAAIEPGPWVAHVSGATPLAALDPHTRRFSVHPLQTFTLDRGPEQLDGAWAAVTAETRRGARARLRLAEHARPAAVRPRRRATRTLYHAGAAIASNYLVTLYRAAVAPLRGRRRAARGARPADDAHDRERLRADRPDRARRLGDVDAHLARDPRRARPSSSRCTARSRRRRAP